MIVVGSTGSSFNSSANSVFDRPCFFFLTQFSTSLNPQNPTIVPFYEAHKRQSANIKALLYCEVFDRVLVLPLVLVSSYPLDVSDETAEWLLTGSWADGACSQPSCPTEHVAIPKRQNSLVDVSKLDKVWIQGCNLEKGLVRCIVRGDTSLLKVSYISCIYVGSVVCLSVRNSCALCTHSGYFSWKI